MSNKLSKAEAALERVRKAGSLAKRESKQRVGVIVGGGVAGALGWAEAQQKWNGKVGPVHVSLLGIPLAFATSIMGKGALARQLEASAGPLVGVAFYKFGRGETVVGGEYDTSGEYG